jgi:hypothetical protein
MAQVFKYGTSLLFFGLFVYFLYFNGEFHYAPGIINLQFTDGRSDSFLNCVDIAGIGPVKDLVLLPSGGVLVASVSANLSQPGQIVFLPSVAFTAASHLQEFRPVAVRGFSSQVLRPQSMHLLAHSEGTLLFVVQQWPAASRAFQRYMQQRGANIDDGSQPLTTVEVFLVVQEQVNEVELIHQRSLVHSSLNSITSVVAASPKQLFVATSCYPYTAPWGQAMEALLSLACCSDIWLMNVDCGSEENCFDTHLGGDLTGSGLIKLI